jgi:hypothetical protein
LSGYRQRLFRAIHAEALKRGFDHDALHDLFARRFEVHSMSQAEDHQLLLVYKEWTGKTLKYAGKLPRRSEDPDTELVSGGDLADLAQEFAKRQMGTKGQSNFVRRQLRGRDVIRTRKDFVRVMAGIRAMNKRDCL